MTGVELIVAALAAGAAAGVTDTAGSMIRDSYAGLKTLLVKRLGSGKKAREALEANATDPKVWQERIGDDLAASGASGDEDILAAARRLLSLLEGKSSEAHSPGRDGDSYHVQQNHGFVGPVHGPATVIHNQIVPPAWPGTA